MLFSQPLAYLLTWTTYGTWLPGDQRGWISKKHGFQPPNLPVERRARDAMSEPVCELDRVQRQIVEETVRGHCKLRGWRLHAVNCRTNHVHVVVTAANTAPKRAISELKAWCTRELKARSASEGNTVTGRRSWWTERGSVRLLFDEASVKAAIQYVVEGQ
jgi:hypothetical protein